jgi:hypothetical protein
VFGFKNFFEDKMPSASMSKGIIIKLFRTEVNQIISNIRLLQTYGIMEGIEKFDLGDSSKSRLRPIVEKQIVQNPKFESWMMETFKVKRYGTSIFSGKEGIVYPYVGEADHFMLKVIIDPDAVREFKIASQIKGEKLVPIVDTFKVNVSNFDGAPHVFYCIFSERLSLDLSAYIKEINSITNKIEEVIGEWTSDQFVNLPDDVMEPDPEKSTNMDSSVKAGDMIRLFNKLRKTFSRGDEKKQKIARELIEVLELVYDRSGFLTGNDWDDARNVGMHKGGRIMPFDYGIATPIHKKSGDPVKVTKSIDL